MVAAEFGALRVFILCEATRYLRFEKSRNGVPMDTFYREDCAKTSISCSETRFSAAQKIEPRQQFPQVTEERGNAF